MPGSALLGLRYEPPFPVHHRLRRARPHRARGRLRVDRGRHGRGPHRRGVRRGRLPARHRERADDPQPRPAGRHLRRAHRPVLGHARARRRTRRSSWRCASPAACSAPASTSTPTRTAGAATRRSSTTPRRTGTCAPPRSRTSCSRRTRRSTGTPSTSSTGASASGSRTTWTGRSRASATGARRCRSGAASRATTSASARSTRSRERGGERPEDVHRPYIDDVVLTCEECGGEMRRVPDLIDVWWDSGCMPFAQWHAPFENEDAVPRALPGGLHLRGARPDARLVLLAARGLGAAVRRGVLQDVPLPRPDPRPGRPEDVEVEGQRGGALGRAERARRGRVPLVLLHLEAALGRLPLLARDGRRVRAPVPEAALEHVRVLRPVRERERAAAAARRRHELDRWIRSRLAATTAARDRAHGGLRHHLLRPGDRRVRRRPLELVRAAARGAASGTATPPPSRRCATACSAPPSCSRRSRRS